MFTKILLTLLISNFSIAGNEAAVYGVRHFETSGLTKTNHFAIEPIINSPSAVVLDKETGRVLFNKNGNEQRQIASITKLITSYLYLKKTNEDLSQEMTMKKNDARNGGQSHVYAGERGTARDFLHLTLVSSDNSAAITLAREGGFLDSFSEETEKMAKQLSLKDTFLVEPSGLDSRNVSTALEIALFAREIFKNDTLKTITTKKTYSFSPINALLAQRRITTTNDLLTTDLFTIAAGKTGHTSAAGFCLVFQARSSDGREIIIALLGADTSETRFQDAKILGSWIFENFR
ncbi:MAG: D-alanyl-D-alanine carboxypeptidase [Candidatus Jacksonbacteria bacterium]|nr:D-alanyl-D-alanine carboxypeptidase [Candidatus Jacksonbacteria bacterium]